MANDAFISYSRQDAAWAQKLEADLRRRGFTVYLDTRRLQAGDDWEEALLEHLTDSKNLILVWTDRHARQSNWVSQEAYGFRVMMFKGQQKGSNERRQILQVCLDGRNPVFSRYQTIDDLNDGAQFDNGPDRVDAMKWTAVLEKLATTMGMDVQGPEIPLVILASTEEQMSAIAMDARPLGALPFGDLLRKLNLTPADIVRRYGDNRWEWRPFGSERDIFTLLSELRLDLLADGAPAFRWRPVNDAFWEGLPNNPAVKEIARRLARQPSVIAIDALSLYDPVVLGRFTSLTDCLYNKLSCVMVLAPFTHARDSALRDAIGQIAQEMYNRFYGPEFDDNRVLRANCGALISDEPDVRRLLTATLRQSRQDNPQWWATVGAPGS